MGDTLTLTTQIFVPWFSVSDNDYGTSDNIALTVGGVVEAENTDIGPLTSLGDGNGEVATITLTYNLTNPSLAGQAVGIEILAPATSEAHGPYGYYDNRYFYDNVSLNVTPAAVPEPSAWAMMLVGLVSLVGLRRFTRKA